MGKRNESEIRIPMRGDIFYVENPYPVGHEMAKDRPCIIVSNDTLNRGTCVTVVMCSASVDKRERPAHITVRETPIQSNALCEHIYTVDKSRLSNYIGRCTNGEMAAIDIGIMSCLGLGGYSPEPSCEDAAVTSGDCDHSEMADCSMELLRAETERDTYKQLYKDLLDRMTMGRGEKDG